MFPTISQFSIRHRSSFRFKRAWTSAFIIPLTLFQFSQAEALSEKFNQDLESVLRNEVSDVNLEAFEGKINELIQTKGEKDQWLSAKGITWFNQGKLKEAAKFLSELKVQSPVTQRLAALAYYQIKDYKAASFYYPKYSDLRNNTVDWSQYADALLESNQPEKAAEEYVKLVQKNPNMEGELRKAEGSHAKDHLFLYCLAKESAKAEKRDIGYGYLIKALKLSKENPQYLSLLPEVIENDKQVLAHLSTLQKLASTHPPSPRLAYQLGRGYSLNKNKPRAAEYFAKVFDTQPQLLDGNREAILDCYSAKDFKLAAKLANRFLDQNSPNDLEIAKLQWEAVNQGGAPASVRRSAMSTIVRIDAFSNQAIKTLASLDLAEGDSVAAVNHLREWLKVYPDDKNSMQLLYQIASHKGKFEEHYIFATENMAEMDPKKRSEYQLELAMYQFEKGDYGKARSSLQKLSTSFASNSLLWFRLGECERNLKSSDGKENYKKAYELNPSDLNYARKYAKTLKKDDEIRDNLSLFNLIANNNPSVEERYNLAKSLYFGKLYLEAGKVFDWFAVKSKATIASDSIAAFTYLELRQGNKAKPILETLEKADPRNLKYLNPLSQIYFNEKNKEQYYRILKTIVSVDASYSDFQLKLARLEASRADKDAALNSYSQWVNRNEGDGSSLEEFLSLASAAKDTSRMIEALGLLIKLRPDAPTFQYQAAEIRYNQNRDPKGIEELVKKYPDYTRGRIILTKQYYNSKQFNKLAELKGFLEENSLRSPEYLEPLADLYAFEKNPKRANDLYFQCLQKDPKNGNLFDKIFDYAKETKSDHVPDLLKHGYNTFKDDLQIKEAYANFLAETPPALQIYREILAKDKKNLILVKKSSKLAFDLRDENATEELLCHWTRLEADNTLPWSKLEIIYKVKNDQKRLLEVRESLYKLLPGDYGLLIRMGESYEAVGEMALAIQSYRAGRLIKNDDVTVQRKLLALLKSSQDKKLLFETLGELTKGDSGVAAEAHYRLSNLYLEKKDRFKAYEHLDFALKIDQANKIFAELLPKVLERNEEILTHFDQLNEYTKEHRSDLTALTLLARGYTLKKDNENASAVYAAMLRQKQSCLDGNRDAIVALYKGQNWTLTAKLAQIYLKGDKDTDTEIREMEIEALIQTTNNIVKLRESVTALLAADPKKGRWRLQLAKLDLKSKDTLSAIINGREWIKFNPRDKEGYLFLHPLVRGKPKQEETYTAVLEQLEILDKENYTDYHYELGEHYFKQQKYREAGVVLTKVSELLPKNARVWHMLGQARTQLKVGDLGQSDFKKAFEMEPENLTYARTYGQTLLNDSTLKANLRVLQFLAGNKPSSYETRQYAKSLYLNKDYKASVNEWEKVLKADIALVWKDHTAARAYLLTEQYPTAEALYEMRLNLENNNMGLLDTLAELFLKNKHREKYVPHIERIVQKDPTFKMYQLSLAREKSQDGEFKVSLSHYSQWTSRNTKDLKALTEYQTLADNQKDTTNLEIALQRLVKLPDAGIRFHYQLAEVAYAKTGSITAIEKLVAEHKDYVPGRFILCREYYKRKTYDKLPPLAGFLLKESDEHPDLFGPLAELQVLKGEVTLAQESFYRHAKAFPQERGIFDRSLVYSEQKQSPRLQELLKLGYLNYKQDLLLKFKYAQILGRTPEALNVYQEILAQDKVNPPGITEGAETAYILKNWTVAEDLLLRWSQIEPDAVKPWDKLMDIYTQTKQPAKLADAMAKRFQFSPKDDALAFETGKLYQNLKDIKRAEIFLEIAAQLKPKEFQYWKTLGLFYYSNQMAEKSKAPLLKAEKLSAFDEEVLYASYQLFTQAKDNKSARDRLRLLNEKNPENKLYAFDLAKLELIQEEPQRVIKVLELTSLSQSMEEEPSFVLLEAYAMVKDQNKALALGEKCVKVFPKSASKSAILANVFFEAGRFAEANKIFDQVLTNSTNEGDLFCAAVSKHQIKDYTGAIALFRKCDPNRKDLNRYMGFDYKELGDWRSAADRFKAYYKDVGDKVALNTWYEMEKKAATAKGLAEALEQLTLVEPENILFRIELADVYLSLKNNEKAMEQFRTVLTADPRNEYASLKLGLYLARSLEYGQAIPLLEKGLSAYADNIEGWQLLGQAYAERKTWDKAEGALAAAANLDNKNKDIAQARIRAAEGLNNAEKCEAAYQAMLRIDGNDTKSLSGLANLRVTKQNWEEAAVFYQKLSQVGKLKPQQQENLGRSLLETGKSKEALVALEIALKEGQQNPTVKLAIARIHAIQGDDSQAEKMFQDLLKEKLNIDTKAEVTYWLGRLAMLRRDSTMAEVKLKESLQAKPSAEAYSQLGELYLQLNKVDQAEDMAQKAMAINPDNPDALGVQAQVLLANGDKDVALQMLQEALKTNPKSCALLIAYSKVNLSLSNYKTTKSNSEYAMNLCPDEPLPYLYAGVVAHRSYQTQAAKKYFSEFKKLGGNEASLPEGY